MTFFKKDIKVIDQRYKENKAHYFLQCGMATVAVMMILLTIDTMFKEVMIASFGATSVFHICHATPSHQQRQKRCGRLRHRHGAGRRV